MLLREVIVKTPAVKGIITHHSVIPLLNGVSQAIVLHSVAAHQATTGEEAAAQEVVLLHLQDPLLRQVVEHLEEVVQEAAEEVTIK